MTTAQFKKGQEVFQLLSWDRQGTVSIRRFTVKSWGKKHGTLARVSDGQMSESRVYTTGVNMHPLASWYFPAEIGVEGIEAEALKLGAAIVAHERTHYAGCRQRYGAEAGAQYLAEIDRCEALLHEPRITYPTI